MDPTRNTSREFRPLVNQDIRALVRVDGHGESGVGSTRIHGELRTLGVDVSERTVSRLLTRLTRLRDSWSADGQSDGGNVESGRREVHLQAGAGAKERDHSDRARGQGHQELGSMA